MNAATYQNDNGSTQEERILADQVHSLYGQALPSLAGNLAIALLTTILFYNKGPHEILLTWFAAISIINLARGALAWHYNKTHIPRAKARTWMNYFLIGILISGATWGSTCFLFKEALQYEQFYFLAFILGGLAGGAAPILASVRYAYSLFLLPTMVPVVLILLGKGDVTSQTMAGMFAVFILIMLMTASRIHRLTRDASELRIELERLAHIDQLTGIANRRAFDINLQQEWSRSHREGKQLSLILVDIDHFKPFNDNLGHQAGDMALKKVARILATEARRPGDIAARLGGEEFGLLLPGTNLEGAYDIAEHLRKQTLRQEIAHPDSVLEHLTISLGISCAEPKTDELPSTLISEADAALYEAKTDGRNLTRTFIHPDRTKTQTQTDLCPEGSLLE